MIDLAKSARVAGVIAAEYSADESLMAYSAIDTTPYGFSNRDVILADELGFKDVPVGLLVEEISTEELWAIMRGTRVIAHGPNEWLVDLMVALDLCPFIPGARSERGFTTTYGTFHLLSGAKLPTLQGCGGHSLAAAWALLMAVEHKANLISFAGPKVGNRAFSDHAMQAIPELVRWVNHPDVVPKVPLEVWPLFEYMHAGPANEFDLSAKIRPDLSLEDRISAYHNIHTYWHAVDPSHPILPTYAAA